MKKPLLAELEGRGGVGGCENAGEEPRGEDVALGQSSAGRSTAAGASGCPLLLPLFSCSAEAA